jgi:hypothetical protein
MYPSNFVALIVLAVMVAVLAPLPVSAAAGVSVDSVRPGNSLVAQVEVPVRDRAPSGGAVYVKGQQTGTLKPGEVITVTDEQMVSTVLGNQKWARFATSDKSSPPGGWVLVGNAGAVSTNFGEKH